MSQNYIIMSTEVIYKNGKTIQRIGAKTPRLPSTAARLKVIR